MSYRYGAKSEANLVGVHPDIVAVARRALVLSPIDFAVHDGVRTLAEQMALVASGASKTLDSYHLTGDAVDLVPYVNGKLRWEHPLCNQVARAVQLAAGELGVRLVWGRVWDMELVELDDDFDAERLAYVRRYQGVHGLKKLPLDDGPHFQRVRT